MRWQIYFVVFLILIFVFTPVFAEKVNLSVNPEWIVANGRDSSTIRVNVTYDDGTPVPKLPVNFSVNDSRLGFFVKDTAETSDGIAEAVFRSKTVSGTANVTATVNGTFKSSKLIYIDHDTPYSLQMLSFPNNATVGTSRNITVRMQDIHGNFIDNRNTIENVSFTIITQEESRFWNSSASNWTDIKTTLGNDQIGMVTANISLYTEQGETRVRIMFAPIIDQTIRIERVADGEPHHIYAVRLDPSVPFLPANGEESFVVTYQLFDQYWNVLNNKVIDLSVSPGADPWEPNITTTYNGFAAAAYGPSSRIFDTSLIATARENRSVSISLPVEFYDPRPNQLILNINPKNLPSLDVNQTSKAIISAIVIDSHGRAVKNQTVTFTLSNSTYSPINSKVIDEPTISSDSVNTGNSGFGYITFIPGRFDTYEIRSVTGNCTVTGRWNGTPKTVIPIWKNYGYLSVITSVSDNNITENKSVDVGVEVFADGPLYISKPIDMIFCTDRGASMLWDTYDHQKIGSDGKMENVGSDDKMRYLYNYSSVIVEELLECENETCDRAGVVSFGPGNNSQNWSKNWPGDDNNASDDIAYINATYPKPYPYYDDFATVDYYLDYEFKPEVKNEIEGLRPFGDPWRPDKKNVPLRYGLYKAINQLVGFDVPEWNNTPRPEAIRAIVVLTDPEWDDWGDPSAGWDGTSVAIANAETKKAPWNLPQGGLSAWTPFYRFAVADEAGYPIPINASINHSFQNMANYASEHNIIIYSIAYPKKDANIEESRERVLRGLADSTGGMYFECRNGTYLKTIFETIGKDLRQRASVNTLAVFNFTNVKLNGSYVNGTETFDYVNSSQSTRTRKWNATDGLLYDLQRNDTQNWTINHKLIFDLGTMYMYDRWIANFTLMSKKVGTAELFEDSYIFSDDEALIMPHPIIQTGAIRFGDVPTSGLKITYFNVSDALHAIYSVKYTGSDVVHVKLYYQKYGDVRGDWKQFAARNYNHCENDCDFNPINDEALLSKWTLGSGQFRFKIEAWANDAPLDIEYDGPKDFEGRFFIWLR
jgi:hypothetical protein